MKIERSFGLVGSAGLANAYMQFVARRDKGDPARIGYREFQQRVFNCEFGDLDGEGPGSAVAIHGAKDSIVGIGAEYVYLSHKFGWRGRDWTLELQAAGETDGRRWDKMVVKLADGTMKTLYFDITEFFGKW
ncbi:hypothetical protein JXD38_03120 [candidate division WOR-3 bacterium]|nr:hypothetical protein [candidate division WOR-3 bacterium]